MRWLAEVLVNTSLLARLQRLVVIILFIFAPTIAHTADEDGKAPDYLITKIRLSTVGGSTPIVFNVRLALTPSQHAYGLMFSPPLPPKSGMLFLFDDMKPRSFWMKNTPIALDMLFFDSNGRLVKLITNAVPNSLVLRNSGAAAKYVLEIGGGEAARFNLSVGTRLQLPIEVPVN